MLSFRTVYWMMMIITFIKEILATIATLHSWARGMLYFDSLRQYHSVEAVNCHHSHSCLILQAFLVLWLLCAILKTILINQAQHIPGFLNAYADLHSHWDSDLSARDQLLTLPDGHQFYIINNCLILNSTCLFPIINLVPLHCRFS